MSYRPAFLAVLLAAASAAPALAQQAYDDQRAGYIQSQEDREIHSVLEFEAPLARYGNWVPSRFGRAWHPRVGTDWRPYTVGRWVDGADGQSWESDEPWGWATYHYGRWGFDDRWGWVWVPDIEWAPAWVAWRDGDQYSGWAPLPPRAGYGYDVDTWDYSQWYAPSWIYVPRAYLYRRNVGSVALPWRGGRNYWNVTRGTYRDHDGSRDYRGQRPQGNYDRGPGRPNLGDALPPAGVRPGQPPRAGGYPGSPRPQDGRPWQGRPGDTAGQPDRNRPNREPGSAPVDLNQPPRSQPDRGQNPRPDRRPGYVPFAGAPGQPQPGTPGRGGRGGAAVIPGSAPAPVATQRPRPAAPPVAASPPPQARPAPSAEAPPRSPVNPRLDRNALRKPD